MVTAHSAFMPWLGFGHLGRLALMKPSILDSLSPRLPENTKLTLHRSLVRLKISWNFQNWATFSRVRLLRLGSPRSGTVAR